MGGTSAAIGGPYRKPASLPAPFEGPAERGNLEMNRKLIALAILALGVISPMIGCGVATTEAENRRMLMRVADLDSKMLVDDIALFAQTNRPLRTSKWVIE